MSQAISIVIIGGGITGLAAAYYLEKHSSLPLNITLVEKSQKLGGKIQTLFRNGFVIEEGPESIVRYKPWGIELCKELGLEEELISPKPQHRHSFILRNNKFLPIPDGVFSMLSQPLVTIIQTFLRTPLLSWAGKLRLALEPFIPSSKENDESIRSFAERRLGKEFLENLLEPLLSGVYGVNAGQFSAKMLLKDYFEAEKQYGSLFMGGLKYPRHQSMNPNIINKSPFVTLRSGLGTLPKKISECLKKTNIKLNTSIKRIVKTDKGYSLALESNMEEIKADVLFFATPGYETASLLKDLSPAISEEIKIIPYSSSHVLTFAFNQTDFQTPPKGYGFITLQKEKLPFLACTFSSNKWDSRAPLNKILLRTYLPGLPDLVNKEKTMKALAMLFKIKGDPLFNLTHEQRDSLPMYLVGHQEKVKKIRDINNFPGIFLAGACYEGVGIPDCIRSAKEISIKILSKCEELWELKCT